MELRAIISTKNHLKIRQELLKFYVKHFWSKDIILYIYMYVHIHIIVSPTCYWHVLTQRALMSYNNKTFRYSKTFN
jgi:hypothetical protein